MRLRFAGLIRVTLRDECAHPIAPAGGVGRRLRRPPFPPHLGGGLLVVRDVREQRPQPGPTAAIAVGFVTSFVSFATPKTPNSGLIA